MVVSSSQGAPVINREPCSISKRLLITFPCFSCSFETPAVTFYKHCIAHTSIRLRIHFNFIPAYIKSLLNDLGKLANKRPPNNSWTNQAHFYKCQH